MTVKRNETTGICDKCNKTTEICDHLVWKKTSLRKVNNKSLVKTISYVHKHEKNA